MFIAVKDFLKYIYSMQYLPLPIYKFFGDGYNLDNFRMMMMIEAHN